MRLRSLLRARSASADRGWPAPPFSDAPDAFDMYESVTQFWLDKREQQSRSNHGNTHGMMWGKERNYVSIVRRIGG